VNQVRIPANVRGEARIILTHPQSKETLHDDWHHATMEFITEQVVKVRLDKPLGVFGDEWEVPRDCWRNAE
jgi:hypothetical protein